MTYPRSRRVVLGLEPSKGNEPFFGRVSSSSSRRLDALFHDWPDQAVGANIYWQPGDTRGHLHEILRETECEIIVALGLFAAEHLGIKKPVLLEQHDIEADGRAIHVLVFPHTSGVNRFWNDPQNRVRAADLLKEVLLS